MEETKEYSNWRNMLSRCRNPNVPEYKNYGGRGISVCDRWRKFKNFFEDMGPRPSPSHSIDRIDVNGNYEFSNCRWATPSRQQRNKRNNNILEYNGQRLCVSDWADQKGLTLGIILSRIALGWNTKDILETPPRWKLKPSVVGEIRKKLGYRNGAELAIEFGVSRGTISLIKNGHIWK